MNVRKQLGLPSPRPETAEESVSRTASLEQVMETFLAQEKTTYALPTYEGRVTTLKRFRAFLKERSVETPSGLHPDLIWEYESVRHRYFRVKKPKKGKVRLRTLRADTINLRVFLRYLYDEGFILGDLCSVLNRIHAQKSLPRPLSLSTIEEWFSLCDLKTPMGLRDRALFELIYGSGLRVGEAVSLKLTDVNLAESEVLIQQTKTKRSRVVPLTRLSVHFLRKYLSEARPWLPRSPRSESALWLTGYGGALGKKSIQNRVRQHYRPQVQSHRKVSIHGLRHSFATHLLQRGASVRHVQEMLGHSCVNSTQVYTLVAIKDLKEVHRRCHPRC